MPIHPTHTQSNSHPIRPRRSYSYQHKATIPVEHSPYSNEIRPVPRRPAPIHTIRNMNIRRNLSQPRRKLVILRLLRPPIQACQRRQCQRNEIYYQ